MFKSNTNPKHIFEKLTRFFKYNNDFFKKNRLWVKYTGIN